MLSHHPSANFDKVSQTSTPCLLSPKLDTIQSRLKKGAAAQVHGQILHILIQVTSIPLFLHFWGVELFGEWLILFAIPAYLAMSGLGFTGVCNREMAMLVARGDRASALKVFRCTLFLIVAVSVAVFTFVCFTTFLSPVIGWLNFSKITHENTAWVIILLTVQVFINFQTGLIYGGFYAEGRYGLGQFLMSLVGLVEFLCLAGVLAMNYGPLHAAAAYTTGRLIGTMAMFILLRKIAPWLTYGFSGVDKDTLKRLAGPSFAAIAFPAGNALNIQGMRIAVGMLLGPAAVTIFTTLRTLTRLALMFLRSVNPVVQPEISIAYGRGDIPLMRKIHRHSCQVSFWGALTASAVLIVCGSWLLSIWTGGDVKMDVTLFRLLLVAAVLNVFWFTSFLVPYATNRHQQVAKVYTLVNIVALISAAGLAATLGLKGVAGTLIGAELAMIFFVLPYSISLVKDSWAKFLCNLANPPWFLLSPIRKNF